MTKISELDKKIICGLLKKGLSSAKIQQKMKRYTHMQIAAIKAWVTMREASWVKPAAKEMTKSINSDEKMIPIYVRTSDLKKILLTAVS